METTTKIVKAYSNNSKKSRLKRKKNKFQRIWDAEKQTYVKVRKPKFAVYAKPQKVEKSVEEQVKAAYEKAKRQKKVKKSVPVNAMQNKKTIKLQQKSETKVTKQIAKKPEVEKQKTVSINSCGKHLVWNSKTNRYKEAALY